MEENTIQASFWLFSASHLNISFRLPIFASSCGCLFQPVITVKQRSGKIGNMFGFNTRQKHSLLLCLLLFLLCLFSGISLTFKTLVRSGFTKSSISLQSSRSSDLSEQISRCRCRDWKESSLELGSGSNQSRRRVTRFRLKRLSWEENEFGLVGGETGYVLGETFD